MSIFKLNKDYFETTQLELNPQRTFNSSSLGNTGSVNLYYGKSSKIKDLKYDFDFKLKLDESLDKSKSNDNIIPYLSTISSASSDVLYKTEITREIPGQYIKGGLIVTGSEITPDKESKLAYFKSSLENLNDYYKVLNPQFSYSVSNYFSLNFFSVEGQSNDRALLYLTPSNRRKYYEIYDSEFVDNSIVNNEITPFTLDFYINPRYTDVSGSYSAGTIFYISGVISLSLIDHGDYDIDNNIKSFKLLLQLGNDSNTSPSNSLIGSYIFTSSNYIDHNTWNRITVRWGGEYSNNGTGSIYINDSIDSNFYYPGNTLGSYQINDVMPIYIGNHSNISNSKNFFNQGNTNKGVTGWFDTSNPTINFTNQLNAELHHILFSRIYYTDSEIFNFSNNIKDISKQFQDLNTTTLVSGSFHSSNKKIEINNYFNNKDHDILYVIPSFWYNIKKYDDFADEQLIQCTPYNLSSAFNEGIHNLNIENFLLNYASSLIEKSVPYIFGCDLTLENNDDLFYDDFKNKVRNLLLLPCDDGNFLHDCSIITNEIKFHTNQINPIIKKYDNNQIYNKTYDETIDILKILYSNPINDCVELYNKSYKEIIEDKILKKYFFTPGFLNLRNNFKFIDLIKNFDLSGSYQKIDLKIPKNINSPDRLLTNDDKDKFLIYRNTSQDIYNNFSIFNISNLFYGSYIKENSLSLIDESYHGFSKIKITLKDNGEGVIYRADSKTKHAEWSKVGNLYGNEGFITILSPALHRFGKNNFSVQFNGTQSVYVYKINAILPGGKVNKSVNPTWVDSEDDNEYVYITDINLHDNNYNVVMKAKLAQPIYKGKNDKFMIRLKYDF